MPLLSHTWSGFPTLLLSRVHSNVGKEAARTKRALEREKIAIISPRRK